MGFLKHIFEAAVDSLIHLVIDKTAARKENKEASENKSEILVVKPTVRFLCYGILLAVGWSAIACICFFLDSESDDRITFMFLAFAIVGIIIIAFYFNTRIFYDEYRKTIIKRNIIRKKKVFYLNELEQLNSKGPLIKAKFKNGTLRFICDNWYINSEELQIVLKKSRKHR